MTFPLNDADVPHPTIIKPAPGGSGNRPSQVTGEMKPTFSITYDEGLKVGYRWYDAEKKPVLFPFGFGLSYSTFSYSGLKVTPGTDTTVTFHREKFQQTRRRRNRGSVRRASGLAPKNRRSVWSAGAASHSAPEKPKPSP